MKKPKPEMKKEETVEIKEPEPPFVVVAPEVEPAAEPIREEKPKQEPGNKKPSILDKWKTWLRDNMDMYNE